VGDCLEGTIIYESPNLGDWEIVVCNDRGHLDYIVVRNSPELFEKLLVFFDEEYRGFADLVQLIIENDVRGHFIGTHSSMNRTLARLRKLRYIMSHYNAVSHVAVVSLDKLFVNITRDLDRAINALMFFKGEYHRVRDRVHQLVYPILRKTLERLLYVTVY